MLSEYWCLPLIKLPSSEILLHQLQPDSHTRWATAQSLAIPNELQAASANWPPMSLQILVSVYLRRETRQCWDARKQGWPCWASKDQHNERNRALQCYSDVWNCFGDKRTSKSHETQAAYFLSSHPLCCQFFWPNIEIKAQILSTWNPSSFSYPFPSQDTVNGK